MLILAAFATAHATTVDHAMSPRELAQASDTFVHGVVADVHAEVHDGRIWTVADVAGTQVHVIGGCTQDVCFTVADAPRLREGEEVYLFLKNGGITGFSQGLFHADAGSAVRDDTPTRTGHAALRVPVAELEDAGSALGG